MAVSEGEEGTNRLKDWERTCFRRGHGDVLGRTVVNVGGKMTFLIEGTGETASPGQRMERAGEGWM